MAALLPRESSEAFSADLLPYLRQIYDRRFPVWERARKVFHRVTRDLHLSTSAPVVQLPRDFPTPEGLPPNPPMGTETITLPEGLYGKIHQTCGKLHSLTLSLFTASFQTLLHRLTLEEDLILGILNVAGKNGNIYKLRTPMGTDLPFEEVVRVIDERVRKQEKLIPRSPLSRLLATLSQNVPTFKALVGSVPSGNEEVDQVCQFFEVALLLPEELESSSPTSSVTLALQYRVDIFVPQRIREILSQITFLLEQVTAAPQLPIGKISLLTPHAAKSLPDPRAPLSSQWEGTVTSYLVSHASQHPDKVAVIHGTTSITYRQLDVLTSRLAHLLLSKGLQKNDSVFIYAYRNSAIVWALLGAMKAGGSLSLMDPAYPPERIINCAKVAEPKAWISVEAAGNLPKEVEDYLDENSVNIRVTLPDIKDIGWENYLGEFSSQDPQVEITPDDVAVITFTSGSTGLPKGVLGRHGPLTHFYPWMKETFHMSSEDRFTMCSGISHDPLQRDIFTPVYLGATLHIPNADDIGTPGQLAKWMHSHRVTFTHLTPAMGQLLSESSDCQVDTLRVALFVGDKLTKRDVFRLRQVTPSVTAVNMYGSTETQRSVSYYIVPPNPEMSSMKEILSVGVGMKDVQLVIVNRSGNVAGVGELGEVSVRSHHLAGGYKGLEEQTQAKFIPNPFSQGSRNLFPDFR